MVTPSARKHEHLSDGSNENQFLVLSSQVSEYVSMAGGQVSPFACQSLPHFSKLSPTKQDYIIQQLQSKVSSLESANEQGLSFRSTRQMLWHFLKEMKLRPTSDILDKLTDEDVVEIHWVDGDIVQAYHSFNFYNKSSYNLEELCSYPWPDLYKTDSKTVEAIFGLAQGVRTGAIKQTWDPGLEPYVVSETQSTCLYDIHIQYKYISPLFDLSGSPIAALSVESLELLESEEQKGPRARERKPGPLDVVQA